MVEIATVQDIERLLEKQKTEIIAAINEKMKSGDSLSNSKWLRTRDVKEMLSVSDATLANYRSEGILISQKIRGSHFYFKSDVLKLMGMEK